MKTLQWHRQPCGKWLHSSDGRYRISRNDIYCDVRYTSYDWYPTVDLIPIVIGTFERKEQALTACELSLKFGGSP